MFAGGGAVAGFCSMIGCSDSSVIDEMELLRGVYCDKKVRHELQLHS